MRRRPRKGSKRFKAWLGMLCLSVVACVAVPMYFEVPVWFAGWPLGIFAAYLPIGVYFMTGKG